VVTIAPQAESPPADAVLDDGIKAPASVYRISVAPPAAGVDGWLTAPAAWASIAATDKPRGIGPWVIVVQTPAESEAKSITVGGRQYALNWLPDVPMLPVPNEEAPEPLLNPWPPMADDRTRDDPALLDRVRSEAHSPITRWRFRLFYDGLAPAVSNVDAPAFADPVLEAIARQNEDRWRVALAWLWSADPELAWRVKKRLAAVVDFGGGVYAPAWPTDHIGMDQLLTNLLDSRVTPERRSELARAWLIDQPAGIAWVMDDAGVLDDATRRPIAGVGFANLTDIATRAWVETSAREDVDFVPILSL
jgi:hypothetical protein